MNTRSLLAVGLSVIAFSSVIGGLISEDTGKTKPTAVREPADANSTESAAAPAKPSHENMENQKVLLNRLVTRLRHSARSFIYLRSVGFTESDEEFEKLISTNNAIFRRVRIIRRDEQGNRQIPGWPGVALTPEYRDQGERR
jgi:hypothetical protein